MLRLFSVPPGTFDSDEEESDENDEEDADGSDDEKIGVTIKEDDDMPAL